MVTREDLQALTQPKGVAISFFMRMKRAGPETRKNPIRLKNRIREVRDMPELQEWDPRDIDRLIAPANDLVEDYEFWQHQMDGLAIFMSDGEAHQFKVEIDLPDLTVVGGRYHLKPLLPLVNGTESFYALAASLGKTRLFEVDRLEAREIELPEGTPLSLDMALRFTEDDPDSTVRWNTMGRTGGQNNDLVALSHGGGPEDPDRKMEILDFFRRLDNGVREVIEGTERPLLFMGVEYLFPIYQEANNYHKLLEEHSVRGNPDQWNDKDIQERAWEAVSDLLQQPRRDALERYANQAGTGETGTGLEEVILAGVDGRIDTLFLAQDAFRWGSFDPENRKFAYFDGPSVQAEDLIDRAGVEALRTGANIFPLPEEEMPDNAPVAAIYRY